MARLGGRIARPDGSLLRGFVSFGQRIVAVEPSERAGDDYILPGFIDLQVNGSHGVDVMTASADDLLRISKNLAAEGTTAWLATAITSPLDRIERANRIIDEAMTEQGANAGADSGASILGMHLEGPFISPHRLGAHPKLTLEPAGEALERVLALNRLRLLTLAPELPSAFDAIQRLCARGVVVSIGHSDATLEQAEAGVAAGARMFTHLFNAMRPMRHRDPGVAAAALLGSAAKPAVIPDAVHVHPAMLRLVYRLRGAAGLILTTDKIGLADAPGASTTLGGVHIKVDGGAARLDDGTLAGSIISMLDGVRVMVEEAGVTPGEAARMAAGNPAAILSLGDRGKIEPGARADLIVLDPGLDLKAVFVTGRETR
jgi:N-acetylglucosamine-6-phosphate deacetylase